jgi:hypothetical protein
MGKLQGFNGGTLSSELVPQLVSRRSRCRLFQVDLRDPDFDNFCLVMIDMQQTMTREQNFNQLKCLLVSFIFMDNDAIN